MAKIKDREALVSKLRSLEGLTREEKSALIGLLREQKTYGLVWENKPEEAWEQLRTQFPVLTEVPERRILGGDDCPNHVIIEGDNLHALEDLLYTHEGKIDVIYIDPPYNTGNKDFVYNDSFVDTEDSFRHSKWLSFIAKRLNLAKRLLSKNGVIFISIDDNEQAQLKLLCDSILAGFDFVATIPWRKRTAKSDVPHLLSQDYEWVLCYCQKDYEAGMAKDSRKYFETSDFPGRPWRVHDLTKQTTALERPNSYFTIVNPKNGEQYPANPNRTWVITKETFTMYLNENRIVFPGDYNFLKIKRPVLRYWKADDEQKAGEKFGFVSASTYLDSVGMTQDGTKDLTDIFGDKRFGFPKPLSLIKHLIKISLPHKKDSTILDFFAGSGTTLHATMALNAEDGGHRQCILVTNNENQICENVTYERNRRVIQGYTTPRGEHVEGLRLNNLRYYRVGFVPRRKTEQNMLRLAMESIPLLQLKHNLYREEPLGALPADGGYHYFHEGDRRMLVILNTELIGRLVEELKTLPLAEPLPTYVYCTGHYPYIDDFREVSAKVDLYPIPYSIYGACEKGLPPEDELPAHQPEGISLSAQEEATTLEDLKRED